MALTNMGFKDQNWSHFGEEENVKEEEEEEEKKRKERSSQGMELGVFVWN